MGPGVPTAGLQELQEAAYPRDSNTGAIRPDTNSVSGSKPQHEKHIVGIKPGMTLPQVELETRMGTLKVDKNYSKSGGGQPTPGQVVKKADSPSTRTTNTPLAARTNPLPVNWQDQEDILGQRG